MVELRAVQREFPLYGTLELAGRPDLLARAAAEPRRARPPGAADGARRRGRRPDRHRADRAFTIRGVITNEPGRRVGDFSLGPRVIIDFADLPATGLLGVRQPRAPRAAGPRAGERDRAARPRRCARDFKDEFVNARSFRSTDDEIGRDFDRAENYLSLVGLVIVILGGIAVSSVTRVFVLQKIRSIAVLKCVGARSDQIIAVYMLQVLTLGLAGSLLGVVLARGRARRRFRSRSAASTSLLADVRLRRHVERGRCRASAVGVLVSLLFSVVPLLQVRFVKPSLLLRDEIDARAARLDADRRCWRWSSAGARGAHRLAGGVAARRPVVCCRLLPGWRSCCRLAGRLLVARDRAARQLAVVSAAPRRAASVAPRQPDARHPAGGRARRVLHRRRPVAAGQPARGVLGADRREVSPDMFLMDIQRDQADGVRAFLADPAHGAGQFALIPVLRARVTGVSGRETNLESFEDVRARGSLAREYTITYRDHLEANERDCRRRVLERAVAGARGVGRAGHPRAVRRSTSATSMRFDILGRIITARVTSVREVDWRDSRSGGFMFVFRPGRARRGAADVHRAAEGPGRCRGARAGSSTTSSSSSRTCR